MMKHHGPTMIALVSLIKLTTVTFAADEARRFELNGKPNLAAIEEAYPSEIRPLMKRLCFECHSADRPEADINLDDQKLILDARKHSRDWQKVGDMLDSGQMPPKDARQPAEAERALLRQWVRAFLMVEANRYAGDPGEVVLRRLNNAEYTYTLRDLTGVSTLSPAEQFPVDGAAGEGFTNTGAALSMSPALVAKYLDAAKEVADHAVLLPEGLRFSPFTTRSDRTNDTLARIREFYRVYSDSTGGDKVNLQGIVFDTNQGGRLPVEKYVAATLEERTSLKNGTKSLEAVATEHRLNLKYLTALWEVLNSEPKSEGPSSKSQGSSLLLDRLRVRWKTASPEHSKQIAADIASWQQALWKFTSVGHIGKLNGPKAWMEPVNPIVSRLDIKQKFTVPANGDDVVIYLSTTDAGDGRENDFAIWERPRFVAPGRPDVLLRDVRRLTHELAARREELFASTEKTLAAAAEATTGKQPIDLTTLCEKHGIDPGSLSAWMDYLGIGTAGPVTLGVPIKNKLESLSGYEFIKGWTGDNALSVLANSSDQAVRVPGNMKPHSIAVHPTPTLSVAVAWKSPVDSILRIDGIVQHAHPECGNGVAYTLELRRGNTRQRLAAGTSQGAKIIPLGPLEKIAVRAGDVVSLVISPRDNNHSCDLTAIDLTLKDDTHEWNMSRDISPNILAGNPMQDAKGNKDVWHFYSEPAGATTGHVIPSGSLAARWLSAQSVEEKQKLAAELQKLLRSPASSLAKDSPDAILHAQLTSLGGPLFASAWVSAANAVNSEPASSPDKNPNRKVDPSPVVYGLDPIIFGKHPDGTGIEPASLCVQAPNVLEIRLPAELVSGAELIAAGMLHAATGKEGSVQLQISTTKPAESGLVSTNAVETNANGPWTSNNRGVAHSAPVLVNEGSMARKAFESSFDAFRLLFPAALCYTKIVPVDEVVTLTLFYREDDHLKRLMLNESQVAQLDQLWNELHYISRDALTLVDAYEQLWQYATQDADPKVFEPLRKPIYQRADDFRKQLISSESSHVEAVVGFARRAYRRPTTKEEDQEVRSLYRRLREQEIGHEDAIRMTIARVLVAPAFLYRIEQPVPGTGQGPVSGIELANRLSYFLWSSLPDAELLEVAESGALQRPDVLVQQMKRMLAAPRTRRLATEFGCQWLHIYEFDQHDEKSETVFPTFTKLRGDMYEESIQFFTDLFQHDRSILNLIDADYTFANETLAKYYGLSWEGASPQSTLASSSGDWRRIDNTRKHARGGILTLAATMSKQAGASRTSPILRGNWLSEVVLGEKLPKPPKNVPQLDQIVPAGLTERQLIERHSQDEACAKCHARIDPLGFALENFDAIGQYRTKDTNGLTIDPKTTLQDGTKLDGLNGLKQYLLTARRDAFVRQFNRKLLGYALGRSVQLSDEPLLTEMNQTLKTNDHRIVPILERIVLSKQFREIRGRDHVTE